MPRSPTTPRPSGSTPSPSRPTKWPQDWQTGGSTGRSPTTPRPSGSTPSRPPLPQPRPHPSREGRWRWGALLRRLARRRTTSGPGQFPRCRTPSRRRQLAQSVIGGSCSIARRSEAGAFGLRRKSAVDCDICCVHDGFRSALAGLVTTPARRLPTMRSRFSLCVCVSRSTFGKHHVSMRTNRSQAKENDMKCFTVGVALFFCLSSANLANATAIYDFSLPENGSVSAFDIQLVFS